MRRIIHNTTAIAACLSLMAPHLAMAQTIQPGDAPQNLILAQAEPAAEGEVLPLVEGTDPDEAPQAGGEPVDGQPADETAPAEEPAPEPAPVEQPAEAPVEAPAPEAEATPEPVAEPTPEPQQDAAPQDDTPPAPRPDAVPEQAPEAAPQPNPNRETPPAAAQGTPPAAGDPAPGRNPQRQDDAPEADEPRPNARPAPVAEAEVTPAQPVPAQAVPEQAEDDTAEADALAEALRADEAAEQAAATETPAAPAALRLATGGVQTERAAALPGLATVLAQEVAGGLQNDSLTCLNGGTFPCADGGRAMTPKGVVVETNNAGELRLAPTQAQMFRVGQNGEMIRRAAEEDTRETEASREAAEATQPVSAAALDAADGSGEMTEQQVTDETTRSSTEDFTTSLRDALAASTGQQPAAREDDDNNTLRNALLLGLGAVAVGTYLNNNRQVALSAPDRVVVTRADGSQEVIKDEVALLRQPGSTVTTENFDDGSSRTIVTRQDGSRVVTIRDANLQVLRRTLVSADGTTTQLIDDTTDVQPVDIARLPAPATVQTDNAPLNEDELRAALQRESDIGRRFTLSQIRNIPEVRALVAPVNIDAVTFDTGSAAIRPDQAEQLRGLGRVIQDSIAQNPREIFMIEGHTDTVGSDAANLALSDRRAETVALALTEYFDVPPENLVTQGYGEQFLRIRSEGDIRENRRASVRRITELLDQ